MYRKATADKGLTSLIPETLEEMETDVEFQKVQKKLLEVGQKELTREERRQRQRSLDALGVANFASTLKVLKSLFLDLNLLQKHDVTELIRGPAEIFQLNIGLYCNQACSHCHVESSPKRTETMDRKTADQCIRLMETSTTITTVDITGGAPELNSQFRQENSSAQNQIFEI